MRTLVISSRETNRRSLLHSAERTRYCTTVHSATPSETYALIEQEWFELVIVDWTVGADLDVVRHLRSNWIYSRTPVLIIAESPMPDDVLEAVDAGADAYLVKPLTPRKLARRIEVLVRMYANAAAEASDSAVERDLSAVMALMNDEEVTDPLLPAISRAA